MLMKSTRRLLTVKNLAVDFDTPRGLVNAVTDVSFLGDHYEYRLSAGGLTFLAQSPYEVSGTGLKAAIDPTAVRLVGSPPDQSVVSSRGEASSS